MEDGLCELIPQGLLNQIKDEDMRLYKTDGIVLSDYELGDQDKIITLLSDRYGKIRAVAKGARRLKSRFAPAVQMLSYITAVLYKSKRIEVDTFNECKINSSFLGIRNELIRLAYGYYSVELIMKFIRGAETPPFLFDLVLRMLFLLERIPKEGLPILMRSFELKMLTILGYRPYLAGCVECHSRVEKSRQVYFSGYEGGILCPNCSRKKTGELISFKTIQWMKFLRTISQDKLAHLRVSQKVREELKVIPESYIPNRLGEEIMSYSFIEAVGALEREVNTSKKAPLRLN